MLAGHDVALAAETGSGKTLAYVLPIVQSLRQRKADMHENRPDAPQCAALSGLTICCAEGHSALLMLVPCNMPAQAAHPCFCNALQAHAMHAAWHLGHIVPVEDGCRWFTHCAIVLTPNMELCAQVVRVVHSLRDAAGTPLATAAILSAKSPPARSPADIVVSTPAALLGLLRGCGSAYGRAWAPEAVAQRARHIVIDEADALLASDCYTKPLSDLLNVRILAGPGCGGSRGSLLLALKLLLLSSFCCSLSSVCLSFTTAVCAAVARSVAFAAAASRRRGDLDAVGLPHLPWRPFVLLATHRAYVHCWRQEPRRLLLERVSWSSPTHLPSGISIPPAMMIDNVSSSARTRHACIAGATCGRPRVCTARGASHHGHAT